MRIISRATLKKFWRKHPGAEQALRAWFKFTAHAAWKSPQDLKRDYVSASFLKDNRVCFNIGGNKYRLIVRANYVYQVIYVRFVGTHSEYDQIDANII